MKMNISRIISLWAVCMAVAFSEGKGVRVIFSQGHSSKNDSDPFSFLAPSSGLQRYTFEEITEGEFYQQVGERLQELLDIRGWKRADLVKASGLQSSQVLDYIFGKRPMRNDNLSRIVAALNQGDLSGLTDQERDKLSGHYLLTGKIDYALPEGIRHFGGALGQRLREARKASGLNQLEASQRLRISLGTIRNLEGGVHKETPIWNIRRYSEVYDVSVDYLINSPYPKLQDLYQARRLIEFEPISEVEIAKSIQRALIDSLKDVPISEYKGGDLIKFLAEKFGLRKEKLLHYLEGKVVPRISTATDMANKVNMSLHRFLMDEEPMPLSPQIKYRPESLGERVWYLRVFIKGWSQRRLAEEAGVAYATIENIELENTIDPQSDTFVGLARALGVSLDYLYETAKTEEIKGRYNLIPGMPPHSFLPFGETPQERINARRIQLGLKHKDLAKMLGVESKQHAEDILSFERNWNAAHLKRVAVVLDVSAHWLLTGKEPQIDAALIRSWQESVRKGMSTGAWLREKRGEKSLLSLANGDKSIASTFAKLESKNKAPRASNLIKASLAYGGVPIDFFLGPDMITRLLAMAYISHLEETSRSTPHLSNNL